MKKKTNTKETLFIYVFLQPKDVEDEDSYVGYKDIVNKQIEITIIDKT